MAGTNKNYVLGKGRLYVEIFAEGTTSGKGEFYFAQTPELSYGVKADTLDHYDGDEGLNVLDEQITTKVDLTGKFKTDNISNTAISLFLLAGASTSVTTAAAAGVSETLKGHKGFFYQLGKTATDPGGVRNISAVTVSKGATDIAANHYTVEADLGRVYLHSDAAGFVDGDDLTVTYTVAASTRTQVVSKDKQVRGALRFIASNPVGENRDFFFPLVNITPDGDYSLKGDKWQEVGFSFAALKLGSMERLYADGRPVAGV